MLLTSSGFRTLTTYPYGWAVSWPDARRSIGIQLDVLVVCAQHRFAFMPNASVCERTGCATVIPQYQHTCITRANTPHTHSLCVRWHIDMWAAINVHIAQICNGAIRRETCQIKKGFECESKVGFTDPRVLETRDIKVFDPELAAMTGEARFYSITYRCARAGANSADHFMHCGCVLHLYTR